MYLRHTTISTSLEFNMKPENQPLEKEIPFGFAIIFRFYSLNLAGLQTLFPRPGRGHRDFMKKKRTLLKWPIRQKGRKTCLIFFGGIQAFLLWFYCLSPFFCTLSWQSNKKSQLIFPKQSQTDWFVGRKKKKHPRHSRLPVRSHFGSHGRQRNLPGSAAC